jgi:hypothetical protein
MIEMQMVSQEEMNDVDVSMTVMDMTRKMSDDEALKMDIDDEDMDS